MKTFFDLERYLENSRKVDTSDLDFSRAKDYRLNPAEVRCLTYMMDIESHTTIYLKALLRTCVIKDPEVVAFLTCWAYEEFFHGRALRQFLEASGVHFDNSRPDEMRRQRSWRERAEELASSAFCRILPEHQAAYLVWGAIQELTSTEAYGILAARTENPILRELLARIIKDERRHFSFYYNKAVPLLRTRTSQFFTGTLLKRFWSPVGEGVKRPSEVRWVTNYLFGGTEGQGAVRRIDSTIARLPGFQWFNLFSRHQQEVLVDRTPLLSRGGDFAT